MDVPIHPDETLDSPLNKKLKIIQKKKGYRYSIDAILLAHFCHLQKGDKVIDLGTGNAIIPILLATRRIADRIVGVEIQEELIDAARRNVAINKMEGQISVIHGDVRGLSGCLEGSSFNVTISNPPFRPTRTGRVSPDRQKALARHEILGSLEDMARISSFLLRPGGRFHIIYPTSRAVDMFVVLRSFGLEPKRVQFVHSNASEDAKLVLTEAVKGSRKELKILEPLFIYDLKGHHTAQMEEIYSTFHE